MNENQILNPIVFRECEVKISNIETAFSSIWLASWKDLDDVLALMKGLSKKSVIPLISKKRVRTVIYFFRQKFLVLTD